MFVDASLSSGVAVVDIVVGVLDADRNVLTGAVTALEFVISEPFEGFSC